MRALYTFLCRRGIHFAGWTLRRRTGRRRCRICRQLEPAKRATCEHCDLLIVLDGTHGGFAFGWHHANTSMFGCYIDGIWAASTFATPAKGTIR